MNGVEKLTGLIVPPFTPMFPDGKINLEPIAVQAELFSRYGVSGVFSCGSTGESFSLTVAERIQVSERWSEVIDDQMKLIVHVGHNCLESAKTLAHHAMQIGADGISACAPNFFKPRILEDLVDFMAEVAAAASNLPFYYYHIPSLTGVFFPMREFLEQAESSIPSLAGIK
ncbi:dihydrodipicolinate synthase family protein, partial [candidate division KSB1 bacterium]|nr:dihydrodipicolinate synthase family protein [candidate division KSB1 bacterium]